jgi:hypothetical protein
VRVNDLSRTASDFSTRGRNYVGPPGRETVDVLQSCNEKGEGVVAQTRWIEDEAEGEARRHTPPPKETRTARGVAYESRFKYEPPYRVSEGQEEAIERVGREPAQPAHETSKFCEAGEDWSPKGRRKMGRREM